MLLYVDEKGPVTADSWWCLMVINTGGDREDSKNTRITKCVWNI
ncbi:MAG TPA: hypothetical protein VIY08_08060 [Candidatus Nitrosocosmicus sp.]